MGTRQSTGIGMRTIGRGLMALCLAGWAVGAGCAPNYGNGRAEAAALSIRQQWRASGDLQSVEKAIDGNGNTAAVSSQRSGLGTLTIDLGKPCLFNMVIVQHGDNEMGFAGRVAVLTSLDGENFTQRHVAPGTRRVTFLYLGGPVLARYVRLKAVVPGRQPWSVAEVSFQ